MGKRPLSVLFAFLFLMIGARGKAQELRTWSEGPLTVSDLTIVDEPQDTITASFIWNQTKKKIHKGRVRFVYYDYCAAFYRESMLVGRNRVSERVVDSLQRLFNLSEYYARAIRDNGLSNPRTTKEAMLYYAKAYRTARDMNLDNSFTLTNDFDITEKQLKKTIGINFYIGSFTKVPFGDMANLVHSFNGYTYCAGLSYDRIIIQVEMSKGVGNYLGSYSNIRGINTSTKVPLSCFKASVNYVLKESSNYRLTVVAGGGKNEYKFHETEMFSVDGNVLTEGIRIDWIAHMDNLFTFPFVRVAKYSPFVMLSSDQQWIAGNKTITPSVSFTIGLSFDVYAAHIK